MKKIILILFALIAFNLNLESSKTKYMELYIGNSTFKPIQPFTFEETMKRLKDKELYMLINDTIFIDNFKKEIKINLLDEYLYPYGISIDIICFIHSEQVTDTIGIGSMRNILYHGKVYQPVNYNLLSFLLDKIPVVYHTGYEARKMFYLNSLRRIK